ncbi:MAG TPA: TetR/AcrR family transcriptional regulator [Solirubrobacteraceae bacterium]|nr:TetR/AcrR family transcriptional regulator [Solirubrobacteraceae bacterium]
MTRSQLRARGPAPLYPQLRPRPHGPDRETIAANQRRRMFGAMIEAVLRDGYDATSVAAVSALAGVSKRTFYEQFDNKQACFLAVYDAIVERGLARVAAAQSAERGWEAGLRRAVEAFAIAAAEHPGAARLALVEAGATPVTAARANAARRRFEWILAAGFERAPGGALPSVVVRAIAGGVEGVVRRRVLDGETDRLPALAGALAAWTVAQQPLGPATIPALAPARCPRDRLALWPRVRARSDDERVRILRAAAEIAAAEGIARLTPMQIVDRAGVSERAFGDSYDSAEACYLDALDLVWLEMITSVASASRAAGDGPRGAYRGIAALMDYVATDSVLRGLILIDAFADGPVAVRRWERIVQRFVDLLASRLPSQLRAGVVAEAAVHAVWGIVRRHVASGTAHQLPGLAGWAAYVALAPVVGGEAAVRAILAEERALAAGEGVDAVAA